MGELPKAADSEHEAVVEWLERLGALLADDAVQQLVLARIEHEQALQGLVQEALALPLQDRIKQQLQDAQAQLQSDLQDLREQLQKRQDRAS